MSFVEAHKEILAAVDRMTQDWLDYELVVELDNRTAVDQNTQTNPYLQVQIVNLSGAQMDLGSDPITEQRGQVLLNVCSKAGNGSLEGLALLEFAARYFHTKDFATVRFHAAEVVKPKTVNGWYHQPAIINFWYYWK